MDRPIDRQTDRLNSPTIPVVVVVVVAVVVAVSPTMPSLARPMGLSLAELGWLNSPIIPGLVFVQFAL